MNHECVTLETVAQDVLGVGLTHTPLWQGPAGTAYSSHPRWATVITRGPEERMALHAATDAHPEWVAVDYNTYDYSDGHDRPCCVFDVVDFEAAPGAAGLVPAQRQDTVQLIAS